MKQLLTIILIATYGICFAQQGASLTRNVDSLIYQYITDHDLPSAAVGVVYKTQVLYEKRIVKAKNSSIYTNDHSASIYNIASVAKPFVATAILQLVQERKIDLKSPIVAYLPHFKIESKFKDDITIEHLLTHTSGLPNISSPDDYDYMEVDTSKNALADHIASLSSIQLEFKPGKKYSYSNVGFEILGQVIAKVSNMSFDAFMNRHLFQPLQMKRTSYILSEFLVSEIAQPHIGHPNKVTDRFPYNRAFSPSGNLFTSIEDLNKWMIFNVNDGHYKDFKPLSPTYFNLLTTPKVQSDEDDFVGLSWFMNNNIVFHDGLDLGYSALMILYKKQQIGITVLINHQEANCNELLNLIAKSIKF